MKKVDLIHNQLPVSSRRKCQFCNNTATVVICNLVEKPTIWMCDEHALHFAEGIIKDVDRTNQSRSASQSVERQEKRIKNEKQMEKQALHVS